ncbi:lycopene beta-cyclase [Saccharopolyspora lacisalsi]|uniref:Lycopene beta-cyclase n=1 Tax=Halosaccharopolyspora lacisalsi TaxID=1000566 RepID=A0A839DRQ4_9PSEU|nr:lycopene cyclase family protein [Halosaccharopolyspora lacisalsi]MBA8823640.1 lycopene beta-cyclase [Halosaccharopolyspora lacisalsi]
MDVLVVGAGPAGRAVAAACSDAGMRVSLLDPAPRRGWANTYATWYDELPTTAAREATATVSSRMSAVAVSHHEWARPYAVLDNTALWRQLWRPGITEVTGKAVAVEHGPAGSTVHLKTGHRIATAVVIDASGAARALCGGRPARRSAEQTAVGAILPSTDAEALVTTDTGVFMDWRQVPATSSTWPTFLYSVPLAAGRTLVEETSLARRPGLSLSLLRDRLEHRLGTAGITTTPRTPWERVRFPVDDPIPRRGRVVPFGACAGFVHPASGFSVSASLRLAPSVAGAISAGLSTRPATAARAAWSVLWSPSGLAVHGLRRRTLEALLAMPPERVPEFFELFFSLPPHHQRAFLSSEPDPATTSAAMGALFRAAPPALRRHLVTRSLVPRHRPEPD